ncbi:MAG: phospho-sugar mutase [Prevotellaceae bacterium]|jgi:phosphoglucomutase|nr:phospho-sugar mutase [Prevotellaceae bacterium]
MNIDTQILERAKLWLKEPFDEDTRKQVQELIDHNPKELTDSFYKTLEFGTGGLRGIMGVGANRVNKYTIGLATQGLCNYLKKQFPQEEIKVAIAHDSRNNSDYFAEIAANVFAANGLTVYLFDALRPTPELSFAVRYLHCKSGIVITASHNPKEYNGYKVYWEDGAQVTPPHDKNIITEVNAIQSIDSVRFNGDKQLIHTIGKEVDDAYLSKVAELSLSPKAIAKYKDMKIIYTPIHGTGVSLVPQALGRFGFSNIIHIPEQDVIDGNFPTVQSPNPEEASALKMAIDKAHEVSAELVMATDPDADRVGIAVRDTKNNMVLLNGNQTAVILIYYLLYKWKENNKLTGKEYIVKTIVTTDLLSKIANDFDVPCYNVLTGFKYIAEVIRNYEGTKQFIGGGEESYGYLTGEFVRDKDAVMSCAMIAEIAAWTKDQNKTLYELLTDIYSKYGFFKEKLVSLTKKGKDGREQIQAMMKKLRSEYPQTIAGSDVVLIHDYLNSETIDLISDLRYEIPLPKSDVLQFVTRDDTMVSIRPSGTEPKIKFYIGVRQELNSKEDFEKVSALTDKKIEAVTDDMGIE